MHQVYSYFLISCWLENKKLWTQTFWIVLLVINDKLFSDSFEQYGGTYIW